MSTKLPPPSMPVTTATDEPKPMKEEYHHHGDPVLEATMKYDRSQEEAAVHRQALKEVYDEHARLMEHERHGAFLGDHTLWYAQDYLPEPKKGEHDGNPRSI